MPLYRRLAHRGFSNYPFKKESIVINLREIESSFSNGDVVDLAALIAKGLAKGSLPVKILGDGDLTKKLSFKVGSKGCGIVAVSVSAKDKIEKAGGSVAVSADA